MTFIEPEHLSDLFTAYSSQLTLYARQWLDLSSAEDVVQDVFIRLMTQRSIPENIRAWLFRSVRNSVINRSRHSKVKQKHSQSVKFQQQNLFDPKPEDLIDAGIAQEILMSLPMQLREIVILRIWGQMTLKEIADIVNQPVSTVHSRYKWALETIKKKMGTSCRTKKT